MFAYPSLPHRYLTEHDEHGGQRGRPPRVLRAAADGAGGVGGGLRRLATRASLERTHVRLAARSRAEVHERTPLRARVTVVTAWHARDAVPRRSC